MLLDNVFSHTPDVLVRLAATVDTVELVVDAGPGLPSGVDVTGRGASGAGSTGLGLSIAARTADDSGGGLALPGPRTWEEPGRPSRCGRPDPGSPSRGESLSAG